MLGYTQSYGLIVQHRHDHRAQRVRRLYHVRRTSLESFLALLGYRRRLNAFPGTLARSTPNSTRTHQALLLIMLEEKADKLRRVFPSVLNTPARLAGVGVSVSW